MYVTYRITGLGPLVFGDGRPFSSQEGSLNLQGLHLPHPSTLMGALVKPLLGEPVSGRIPGLDHFMVQGPLLRINNRVCYPLPLDGVPMKRGDTKHLAMLRPTLAHDSKRGPTDAPDALNMLPSCDLEKLEADPNNYVREKEPSVRYLADTQLGNYLIDAGENVVDLVSTGVLPVERRIGVGIDFGTQSAAKGMLFSTSGVHYGKGLSPMKGDPVRREPNDADLMVRVSLPNDRHPPEVAAFHFGGEARHAVLHKEDGPGPFACPDAVKAAIAATRRIKLVLATPAQFNGGWLPDWRRDGVECPNARLRFKLISACVGRRVPVSGWGTGKNYGPKPVTWLAPAGSVYFLELIDPPDNCADKIAEAWLQPVSDDSKFRRNGFGLALWGTW